MLCYVTLLTVQICGYRPNAHIIWPHDIVVGGLIVLPQFFYLSFLFVSYPSSSLNGTQPKPDTCSDVSVCLKHGVYPFPKNRGPNNHILQRLPHLTANLTAYIFWIKHDIHNRANALETTRSLLHRLKMSWTLVHKRLKIGPKFFCILLHCYASQSDISKQNSTKLCQTVDSKSW